ncbi:MAG: 1,4-alpha-glucan branching enzyme, partial [Oscillospiraceae bacterium]
DGTPQFEYVDPQRAENRRWGSINFDLGKPEVQSFLISSILYWVETFHIDGIRVDAVSSMIYRNYDDGPFTLNHEGGYTNLEGYYFLQKLNAVMKNEHPEVMMIAEESSSETKVTGTIEDSLGFDYKWNMGWMNDMLSYMSTDPLFRTGNHAKVTFSFFYAFSENFVLPISHDEVVHGKCSLINKMPGEYEQKFAGLRTFYGYMMAHPGKKMLFMGQEFAQFTEWSETRELDWGLLKFEKHEKLKAYVKALNEMYKATPAMWEIDFTWQGFQWIVPDDSTQSIIAFMRRDKSGKEIIAICNFAPVKRERYCIGVPRLGQYKELLSSDYEIYGGTDIHNGTVTAVPQPMHGQEQSIALTIPPMGTIYIDVPREERKIKTTVSKLLNKKSKE